jgi:hypothetical protein
MQFRGCDLDKPYLSSKVSVGGWPPCNPTGASDGLRGLLQAPSLLTSDFFKRIVSGRSFAIDCDLALCVCGYSFSSTAASFPNVCVQQFAFCRLWHGQGFADCGH